MSNPELKNPTKNLAIDEAQVRRVVIIGAGGHGSELSSYIRDLKANGDKVELVGFIDDNKPAGEWGGCRVLGAISQLNESLSEAADMLSFITAVGDNQTRKNMVDQLTANNNPRLSPWTLRHPSAVLGRNIEIGAGTCIAPGSIVTTNVRIGAHCILNVKVTVSHDSAIGDFANLNPGVVVAGNVNIGTGAYIGAGATLIDRVKVGEWAVIGAGAVVVDDIPAHTTAVGVPARVIKHHG